MPPYHPRYQAVFLPPSAAPFSTYPPPPMPATAPSNANIHPLQIAEQRHLRQTHRAKIAPALYQPDRATMRRDPPYLDKNDHGVRSSAPSPAPLKAPHRAAPNHSARADGGAATSTQHLLAIKFPYARRARELDPPALPATTDHRANALKCST